MELNRLLLSANGLVTCEISHAISERAALIRANYRFRTPDAIQLATAIVSKADYFLTNDASLKQVKELKVILLEDYLTTQ